MNNYGKYTTKRRNSKAFAAVMAFITVLLIAWLALELIGVFAAPSYEPDIEIPMTNAQIGWAQTWHRGAWGK